MDISIVVPAYNEEKRLGCTLGEIREHFLDKDCTYEVILVDDGSVDDTVSVARSSMLARESNLRIIKNDENKGKGYSVRRGIKDAVGKLILFMDADLSTPIGEIEKLKVYISEGFDIAIVSRSIPGSLVKVSQPKYRVLMGKTFNWMVRTILLKDFIDTQCGFKLLKRNCAQSIFSEMKIDGFSFDVEMLYLAVKKGFKIKEVPVVWKNSKGSKVNPIYDSAKMFMDLLYIKAIHTEK